MSALNDCESFCNVASIDANGTGKSKSGRCFKVDDMGFVSYAMTISVLLASCSRILRVLIEQRNGSSLPSRTMGCISSGASWHEGWCDLLLCCGQIVTSTCCCDLVFLWCILACTTLLCFPSYRNYKHLYLIVCCFIASTFMCSSSINYPIKRTTFPPRPV